MTKLQLKAEKRKADDALKKLRKTGTIPAVVYGRHTQNENVAVAGNEFEKVLRQAGESTLIELALNDGSVKTVLIHDLQRHPVTYKPIHADFLEVSMTEKLKATVHLELVGESLAVKALGGTLVKPITEVEVECLPNDLPHNIEVDITSLATFEDNITVADLKVPSGVEILTPAEEVIAKVQPPRDVAADLAKEVGDVAQVEGIKEEPKEEGAEAASPEAKKE